MTGAGSSRGGSEAVRRLARLAVDAPRVGPGARPELPAALRLQRRRDAGFGVAHDFRGLRDVSRRTAFLLSTGRYVSAAHGGTIFGEVPDFDALLAAARACRPRSRSTRLAGRRRHLARAPHARRSFLAGGAEGHGEAAPGDHLQTAYRCGCPATSSRTAARRGSTRTRSARVEPRHEFRGLAVRAPVLAAVALARAGRRLERVRARSTSIGAGLLRCGGSACWAAARARRSPAALASRSPRTASTQSAGHLLGPISLMLRSRSPRSSARAAGACGGSRCRAARSRRSRSRARCTSRSARSRSTALRRCAARASAARSRRRGRRRELAALFAGILVHQVSIVELDRRGRAVARRRVVLLGRWRASYLDHAAPAGTGPRASSSSAGSSPCSRSPASSCSCSTGALAPVSPCSALGALVPLCSRSARTCRCTSALWHAFPPFRFPRVPERLMPIACLASPRSRVAVRGDRLRRIARRRRRRALRRPARGGLRRRHRRPVQRAPTRPLAEAAPGRLLELPVFPAGPPLRERLPVLRHGGAAGARRRLLDARAAGRGTGARQAPPAPVRAWGETGETLLRNLGVRHIAVHGGLYRASPLVAPACRARAEAGLRRHGWRRVARDGPVALYARAG